MADTAFKLEKHADHRTQYLVSGYLNALRKSVCANTSIFGVVPPLIYGICLTYYYDPEHFARTGKHIQIDEDKLTAFSETNQTDTVYGNCCIPCKLDNGAWNQNIYEWTFVINSCYFIAIGIDEADAKWVNTYFYSRNTKNYAFTSNGDVYTTKGGMPQKYYVKYNTPGSQVIMRLNLSTRKLSYYVQQQHPPEVTIDDICVRDGIVYKLAVFLWAQTNTADGLTSSITMKDFRIQNNCNFVSD
eukprot:CAMPEP_0197034016 /NCGR_PEP_ID=MMETSP1384-20130603/12248_1 /TAXON_ID=29189 /ORGANISM="Ammonia sp." /LENGTH=243 /DNA_ID=CAMNT_0042463889 /DNA_START=11 /DNA_END=740 /DNA_ORIENTATION=-